MIPLKGSQFDGRKMGFQSGAAENRLDGKLFALIHCLWKQQ